MKNVSLILVLFISYNLCAQNVGIGTNTPKALLHVQDSNVLFTGYNGIFSGTSVPPVSGAGSRFMWYGNLSALRAGRVTGNSWDADSIGQYSVALGSNVRALGTSSIALGASTQARGGSSVALGNLTIASGTWSTAIGNNTEATGDRSIALGFFCKANGHASVALGFQNEANGRYATAMGNYTVAAGENSTTMGYKTDAGSFASTTMGYGTIARGYACTAVGYYNTSITIDTQTAITSTSPMFIVGNGTDAFNRKNAFVVLKNGHVGIGDNSPSGNLVINDNEEDPIIQLQATGHDIGFIQVAGNNLRLGTNSSNSTGNVVIRVNGGDRFTVFPNGNATLTGTLTQNSDVRFKKNISKIENALDKVMRLNGYQYQWKEELKKDNRMQIGLIAQNVEAVLPELVTTNKEGDKSVAYQNLVPVLIEAIKEQQQLINEMKKQIGDLQKEKSQ